MVFRFSEDDAPEEVHEINVTPFIDVMLVLLVIFMVATPLATVDTVLNLPPSNAAAQPRLGQPVFLTLRADRAISYGAVMGMMNMLRQAGYLKIGLVGLKKDDAAP